MLIGEMGVQQLLLFILLVLLAEIIGTVGGFGSSMLFVPIASFFIEFHYVLGITALFHVLSNLSKIYLFRKGFNKALVMQLGIPAVIAVVIGAWCTRFIDTKWLEIIMGIMLMLLSLFLFIFSNKKLRATLINTIGGGIISGFVAGLLGTGGAIRGLTLSAFALNKDIFIATSAIIDLGVDFSRSLVYFANGYLMPDYLKLIPILLVLSYTGSYLGKKILNFVPEAIFKKIVLILVSFAGIITILKWLIQ